MTSSTAVHVEQLPLGPAPLAERQTSAWIQSPAWDLFWMFSGIWLSLLFLASGIAFHTTVVVGTLIAIFQHGVAVAHAWSTTYMVVGSSMLKEARTRSAWRYRLNPVLITAVCFALGFAVAYLQTFSETGLQWTDLPIYFYAVPFLIGHFWHFGKQDFGVLSLYRQRARQLRVIDRHVDNAYVDLMMFAIQPLIFLKWGVDNPLGHTLGAVIPGLIDSIGGISEAAYWASLVLSSAALIFELTKPNRSWPRFLYLIVIASHPVLLYKKLIFYPLAYMWSHWLIATGLVSRININYISTSESKPKKDAILRHLLIIGGITALVWGVTQNFRAYSVLNSDFAEIKTLAAGAWNENRFLAGLLLGYFLAEQHLHYYCDRCLFRFKDDNIRKTVGSLL
jgi:hypothetical protein